MIVNGNRMCLIALCYAYLIVIVTVDLRGELLVNNKLFLIIEFFLCLKLLTLVFAVLEAQYTLCILKHRYNAVIRGFLRILVTYNDIQNTVFDSKCPFAVLYVKGLVIGNNNVGLLCILCDI